MTLFDQSYVVSAEAMADTIFVANKEYVVSQLISALIMGIKRTFSRSLVQDYLSLRPPYANFRPNFPILVQSVDVGLAIEIKLFFSNFYVEVLTGPQSFLYLKNTTSLCLMP